MNGYYRSMKMKRLQKVISNFMILVEKKLSQESFKSNKCLFQLKYRTIYY